MWLVATIKDSTAIAEDRNKGYFYPLGIGVQKAMVFILSRRTNLRFLKTEKNASHLGKLNEMMCAKCLLVGLIHIATK